LTRKVATSAQSFKGLPLSDPRMRSPAGPPRRSLATNTRCDAALCESARTMLHWYGMGAVMMISCGVHAGMDHAVPTDVFEDRDKCFEAD
jgi:hypothetical protein